MLAAFDQRDRSAFLQQQYRCQASRKTCSENHNINAVVIHLFGSVGKVG